MRIELVNQTILKFTFKYQNVFKYRECKNKYKHINFIFKI